MSRLIYYNIFVFFMLIFNSCGDNVIFDEKDIKKYPWLTPFITNHEYINFKGVHNIDLGVIRFNYEVSNDKIREILCKIDSVANKDQWETINKTRSNREFSKLIPEMKNVNIKIKVDTVNNIFYFVVK